VQVLSTEETILWCRQHEIASGAHGLPERSGSATKFKIPEDAQKRVALVAGGMRDFSSEPLVLVWFHERSVWPSGQRMHVFDRFRMSYGESRWLIHSPGHVFDEDEIEDAVSFVSLGVLFLWDCYIVTPKRSKLLFFPHDEFGLADGVAMGVAIRTSTMARRGVTGLTLSA
jgi:hypothetical protein